MGGFVLTATGIERNASPSFDDWQQLGTFVMRAANGVKWWLGDWLAFGEDRPEWGSKYEEAVEATGLDYGTLANAKSVSKAVGFSLRNENLSWNHHCAVAGEPEELRAALLQFAEDNDLSVADLRKHIKGTKEIAPLPPGKFRVLLADPPWEYGDKRGGDYGGAENHYPTMATAAICAMPVQEKVGRDAVCFVWATVPLLPDAVRVMEAWGFEYKTHFVWDKQKPFYGHYSHVRHELLLLGTKGSCVPDGGKWASVITVDRSEVHSQKPSQFYELIESMYKSGPYVELFARETRDGWSSWGNEI